MKRRVIDCHPESLPRREFLRLLAGAAAFATSPRIARAFDKPAYPFSEVPASTSGITWTHTAGHSPEKYLPESTGAGCAFLDYDNDGWMDIYLVNSGKCDFFTPAKPLRNALYHNNRDGTFTDVSQKTGIADNPGKGWGVVATDINNDGYMDLFVANDTVANFLFVNKKGLHFEEIGFTAGVAYGEAGKARSGMGVDSADINQDGWMDLFVTNLNHEFYGFYQNKHDETFDDIADATGIANVTKLMSGWGVKFFDYDNDGNLDLLIANGHPDDLIDKIYSNVTYREP